MRGVWKGEIQRTRMYKTATGLRFVNERTRRARTEKLNTAISVSKNDFTIKTITPRRIVGF
jgi:hypothetical protein